MAELTEAKIEELRGLAARDPITFPEARTMQIALPALLDLAASALASEPKGGDAIADISATSGIQTSPDATSPGRECEPAGASEEDEGPTEWFWRIVDADGLNDVSSDEEMALRELCRKASRATAAEAEAESWKNQFHSAAEAASMYVEFYEQHHADFDPAGNYIPHSQIDGDLRAVEAEATDLRGQLDAAHSLIGLNATEIDALKSEAERLRKALTQISCPTQTKNLLWWQIAARTALEGKTDE